MVSKKLVSAGSWRVDRAFSLLEVVFALGIFITAILTLVGSFSVIANFAEATGMAEGAARVADALVAQLRSKPFQETVSMLIEPDDLPALDMSSTIDSRFYFSNLAGDVIAPANDAAWRGRERERLFEIALVRVDSLSPAMEDRTSAWVIFAARLRWPALVTREGLRSLPSAAGEIRSSLLVIGSVHR